MEIGGQSAERIIPTALVLDPVCQQKPSCGGSLFAKTAESQGKGIVNEEMKILYFTEQWVNGGICSFIMNLLRNFELSEEFKIDIAVAEDLTDFYDGELRRLGVTKRCLAGKTRMNPALRMLKARSGLEQMLREEDYHAVHLHICNSVGFSYAAAIKRRGAGIVFVHSHNSMVSSKWKRCVNHICKYIFCNTADIRYACSDLAAQWMFTDRQIRQGKVALIKNGIDIDRFSFDEGERSSVRNRLGIKQETLICHIGRYIPQKNHAFLLQVFKCLREGQPGQVKLLLIGEGALEKEADRLAGELGIAEDILKIKNTTEVAGYLSASDVFVLPSRFEGLPVVGIEAQANGIPCVFADTITRQAKILDAVEYIDLGAPLSEWAEKIRALNGKAVDRRQAAARMKTSGYDIRAAAERIRKDYEAFICM